MIRLSWRTSARRERLAGSAAQPASGEVRGERDAAIGAGARSLQSRMSSLLAAGLMTCVGAGMLAWYYGEVLSRPAAPHRTAHVALHAAPGGGMILPPFGPGPAPARARAAEVAVPAMATMSPSQSPAVTSAALQAASLLGPPLARAPQVPPGYGAPPRISRRQQALERRLSGKVFVRAPEENLAGGPEEVGARASAAIGAGGGALRRLLRPSVLAATQAQVLPTRHLLLPKGTFIDCTLETAIDSTLPGMTTCITATDTFSADGTVVLLERGTQLIGETRGEVRQGQARVFVVWTEARTPRGVVVRLDSPGTDALGRSGLAGKVNRHFWERFGAAALISTLDGAVQSEVESSSRGGTLILNPTGSEDVLSGILRSTVDIPPTIRVRNGTRIQVLVARNVDFRSVYELEPR